VLKAEKQKAKGKMQTAKCKLHKKHTACIINVEATVVQMLNIAVLENGLYIVFKLLFL
jgi:hypothetical protein